MAEYNTFERIVSSIINQVKPFLTDDVILSEEWYMDMVDQSRAAMINSLYVSGSDFNHYYQEMRVESEELFEVDDIPLKFAVQEIICPQILNTAGKKNIQYLGNVIYGTDMIKHVSFQEFMTYEKNRFGGHLPIYTTLNERILMRNTNNQKEWLIRALFASPMTVDGFSYTESFYPIDPSNLRQLEIIVFQHIASKLGMPVDMINNGIDESKQQRVGGQQQRQEEEAQ